MRARAMYFTAFSLHGVPQSRAGNQLPHGGLSFREGRPEPQDEEYQVDPGNELILERAECLPREPLLPVSPDGTPAPPRHHHGKPRGSAPVVPEQEFHSPRLDTTR